MLSKGKNKRSLGIACSAAAQQRSKRPARDRSCLGANDAVTERDPRRPRDLSPNSRRSRSVRRSSSHLQDRDPVMESTSPVVWSAFVGIDVAKRTWDVHVRESGRSFSVTADDDGLRKLVDELSPLGRCLIVVESTGGYERRLAGELLIAGHDVSTVNPR